MVSLFIVYYHYRCASNYYFYIIVYYNHPLHASLSYNHYFKFIYNLLFLYWLLQLSLLFLVAVVVVNSSKEQLSGSGGRSGNSGSRVVCRSTEGGLQIVLRLEKIEIASVGA